MIETEALSLPLLIALLKSTVLKLLTDEVVVLADLTTGVDVPEGRNARNASKLIATNIAKMVILRSTR